MQSGAFNLNYIVRNYPLCLCCCTKQDNKMLKPTQIIENYRKDWTGSGVWSALGLECRYSVCVGGGCMDRASHRVGGADNLLKNQIIY